MGMGSCARSSASGELEQALAKEEKLTGNQPSAKSDTLPEERFEEEKQREQADESGHRKPVIELELPWHPRNYIIRFVREGVAEKKKVLDVRRINPYRNLPYPIEYMSEDSVDFSYDLSTLTFERQKSVMEGMRINLDALYDGSYLKVFVKAPVVVARGNTVAIAFHISYYSNEEDILGTQGVVIFYNEKGEEIRKIEDDENGFYDIRLSADGKYLLQKYGVNYGEDGSGQLDSGLKFYDVETGEMVFEWKLGKDDLDGYNMFFNTYFATCYRDVRKETQHFIVDFVHGDVYFKSSDRYKYANDPEYRKTVAPDFVKLRTIDALLKNDFKKIN